jgi:hypothetical protein
MKHHDPLKKILSATRRYWDRDEMRAPARLAFRKAMECRTAELGGEYYCSENQELILHHTCKSRACPSCGYRANVQWLRERWAALPDSLYKAITFTMPDLLWPFFRDNPALAKALPALAAEVIRAQVGLKHGLRVGIVAILHTFNGKLAFNPHVHSMVTGGGLHGSDIWVPRVYYDHERLMKAWRKAVIALLQTALRAGQVRTELTADQMGDLLTHLEKRWWNIKIQSFENKWHFLQYAGRYVRRPPIAQRRITRIAGETVRFWYKDKKLRRRVEVQYSLEEFIDGWAQHIPERYQNAVRSFGLFAPHALGRTSAAIFAILGLERRPRPKPRRWAESIKRDFGRDPLLDHTGTRMKWAGRVKGKVTP